jgi:hypothetical protein
MTKIEHGEIKPWEDAGGLKAGMSKPETASRALDASHS